MDGHIRTKERCPKCGGKFELAVVQMDIGLYCQRCHTTPRRVFIDLHKRGKKIKLYVDGQRVDREDFDVELWSKDNKNSEPWSIGALSWSSRDGETEPASDELDGRIDELMIFDERNIPSDYVAACAPISASD